MASTDRLPLLFTTGDPWAEAVSLTREWAREREVELRDAIVLTPFAQHLPLARRAWAATASWMPRIETTQTLARGLGPEAPTHGSQLRFDLALDRLGARRMLNAQGWAVSWRRSDPRGFDSAVAALVTTAQALARAAAAVLPGERPAHWSRARSLLMLQAGPGSTERTLARIALEWAAASGAPATDALFALRPAAWIVVQAGGPDALARSVLAAAPAGTPCLLVDSDMDLADPYGAVACRSNIRVAVCIDFEDEAQRTAAQVIADLERGAHPVALIAEDRLLTRRVRALLARQHVPIQDETGWKLSTTRAAARVASLLHAAHHDASSDDWLDWLKGCVWPELSGAADAIAAFEVALRRHGWSHPAAVDASRLEPATARMWTVARTALEELRAVRRQGLDDWLAATASALEACGSLSELRADEAGRQVLAALHLPVRAGERERIGIDDPLAFDEFEAWVEGALEDGSYLPAAPADALVVVTPLERAMLRPFGAVVLAAADEKRLGAAASPQALLGDAVALQLGIPSVAMRRDSESLAFAQVLRAPGVSLLRRLDDGGEALGPSPLLERLELARAQRGEAGFEASADAEASRVVAAAPVPRPQPSAAARLPQRLSASACAALRTCPYRFFALHLVGLREADELDDELEKRDYGSWLHAVLHRFHATRNGALPAADEVDRLQRVAAEVQEEMHLDPAAFLPFGATFARFAPRYVEWLHGRDAGGARWLDGEVDLKAQPPEWAGIEMFGRLDRIDSIDTEAGPALQLIDYKTGNADALRSLVAEAHEDTQLAFYAALLAGQSTAVGPVEAFYLPLDEREAIKPVDHLDVETSARWLVVGIGAELARIRSGAALPALGVGTACDFCAARGLCRRDQWQAVEATG